MKAKSLMAAVALFLLGLLIALVPCFSGHRLESQAEQAVERFNETASESKNEESPPFTELKDGDFPYPELFHAAQEYNEELSRNRQAGFTSPYVSRILALMTASSGRYASPSLV